jgi:putrescine transport system substrate-binding protein
VTRPRNKTGKIEYSLAKQGDQLWFGFLVVAHKATNREDAYKFINCKIRPEVARANTNFIQYANPIMNLAPFIEKSLWVGPGLYPPQTVTQRLAVQSPVDHNVADKLKEIWVHLER